jgi:hypothetical protein
MDIGEARQACIRVISPRVCVSGPLDVWLLRGHFKVTALLLVSVGPFEAEWAREKRQLRERHYI